MSPSFYSNYEGLAVKRLLGFVLLTFSLTSMVFAQDRYISDQLFAYLHAGPSSQYRILGSVNAGMKITLISVDEKSGYAEIIDAKGHTGWVESRFITKSEGLTTRFPRLEEELQRLKTQLANANQETNQENVKLASALAESQNQVIEIEQSYSDINQQLIVAQDEIRELSAKLDTQKEDLLLKYFTYGGGVAGVGLLFGLVLPHLIPRRKKKPSGW